MFRRNIFTPPWLKSETSASACVTPNYSFIHTIGKYVHMVPVSKITLRIPLGK